MPSLSSRVTLMCIGFLLAHLVARKTLPVIGVDALTTPLASASMYMLAATNVGRKDISRLCADLHPSHRSHNTSLARKEISLEVHQSQDVQIGLMSQRIHPRTS